MRFHGGNWWVIVVGVVVGGFLVGIVGMGVFWLVGVLS